MSGGGGGSDGNEEFYQQLRLQQLYEARRSGEGEPDPFTYVDPADGTAYEWDREKKAWFPKVRRGARVAAASGAPGSLCVPEPFPLAHAVQERGSRPSAGAGLSRRRGPMPLQHEKALAAFSCCISSQAHV
uniref:Uncharacterized protein n=1 Tax=Gopherus agassizii TaxID=38772 RepID=A0A452HZR1_9SAUR